MTKVHEWIWHNPEFPPSNVYQTNNEYLAITAGIIEIEMWEDRIAGLIAEGKVPEGSFCSAKGLVTPVSPYEFMPPLDPLEAGERGEVGASAAVPSIGEAMSKSQTDDVEAERPNAIAAADLVELDAVLQESFGRCHNKDNFEGVLDCLATAGYLSGPYGPTNLGSGPIDYPLAA
ncbi:hypothetical protein Q9295_03210 [Xinfangfangia sp. CPCC 101601]|uniref:Uncharacterized protein n=1 Tax=Pseudogemmobacter lacusdianii TaxID=3069608 RepID=A0ABU0VUG2_9RHOB|nr:hypothetical protein [Xinfangfangia sp. CPCC 101601]MDQ2065371.1 hypothetical protein [Xinfangfangia sp. CPCC 101601]